VQLKKPNSHQRSCRGILKLKKIPILTEDAPAPSRFYSQAIVAGDFVFVAGQAGRNPMTGKLPKGLEAQVRQTLENIRAILDGANCGCKDVVKVTVWLRNIKDKPIMDSIYAEYFPEHPPARTTLPSSLHDDVLVEVDCIAVK
jgi:2-iminobutanoate/2-iminopropanoate deaminase